MAQVSGRVYVSVNGTRVRSKAGALLDVGGTRSTPHVSDQGIDFTEEAMPPYVECAINDTADVDIQEFRDFLKGSTQPSVTGLNEPEQTMIFETDTGKMYTIHAARIMEPPRFQKGEWSLKFTGSACTIG